MTDRSRGLTERQLRGLRLVASVAPRPEDGAVDRAASVPRFEAPSDPRLHAVVHALRAGCEVSDEAFDAIYPKRIRDLSARHWTPVAVARQAAALLALDAGTRVLDVGAGAGKFCLVAALTTSARFVGVEQRGHLVELARSVSAHYGCTRAEYVHADIADIDWTNFDAFYLYNPFAENYFGRFEWIDDTVALTQERCDRDLDVTFDRLARARIGTRVVTYHGPRMELPESYALHSRRPAGSDVLELWIKVR